MKSYVGAFEAKTHLVELLVRVVKGESITITEVGKPIAKLVPVGHDEIVEIKSVVKQMLAYRDEMKRSLDGITIRELAEEGRR